MRKYVEEIKKTKKKKNDGSHTYIYCLVGVL